MQFIQALKEKDHRRALYAALIFLMLMILFFLLVSLEEPDPPLKEKIIEIEMEFGSEPEGGGVEKQDVVKDTPQTKEEPSKNYDTQDESPVVVKSGKGTVKETNNTQTQTQSTQTTVDNTFTFGGSGGGQGGGTGTGFGDGSGVGGNGSGNNPGDGHSTNNPNRKIVSSGGIDAQTQEEGKIALDLWVDQNGKVVKTRYNESKSNTGNENLKSLAEKWARTMQYEKLPGAPDQFVGTQVFTFKKK